MQKNLIALTAALFLTVPLVSGAGAIDPDAIDVGVIHIGQTPYVNFNAHAMAICTYGASFGEGGAIGPRPFAAAGAQNGYDQSESYDQAFLAAVAAAEAVGAHPFGQAYGFADPGFGIGSAYASCWWWAVVGDFADRFASNAAMRNFEFGCLSTTEAAKDTVFYGEIARDGNGALWFVGEVRDDAGVRPIHVPAGDRLLFTPGLEGTAAPHTLERLDLPMTATFTDDGEEARCVVS